MTNELITNNFATSLAQPVAVGDSSIQTQSAASAALQGGQFRVQIDGEYLLVTSGQNGTTWQVQRGIEGTTATSHLANALVSHKLTAGAISNLSISDNQLSNPVQTAAQRVFDVTAYGAVADSNGSAGNGTDNTGAFVAAVAAASISGGIVFVPKAAAAGKVYRLATKNLLISASNVHLRGAGPGASALFFDTTAMDVATFGRVLFDGATSTALSAALSTAAPITALPVAALVGAMSAGSSVYLVDTVTLSHQTFTVAAGGAAIGATSIPVNSQTPNFAFNAGSAAVSTSGSISNVSCRDLTVFNLAGQHITGTNYPGFNGCACQITFRNCNQFLCDNVEVYNSPNYGILADRCNHGTITRCHSHDHDADGIHAQNGCTNIVIAHNHCHDTGDDLIGIGYNTAGMTDVNDGIEVIGNTITRGGSRGISLMGPLTNCSVIANHIENTYHPGVSITQDFGSISKILVANNTIEMAGRYVPAYGHGGGGLECIACGIIAISGPFSGQEISIIGNVISDPQNGGIYFIWNPGGSPYYSIRIADNIIDMPYPTNSVGALANAGSGGGVQTDTPGSRYPGIWLQGCSEVAVHSNTVGNAYHEAVLADSNNGDVVEVFNNIFRGPNRSAAGGTYVVKISSGPGLSQGNVVTSAGTTAGNVSITTAGPPTF